MAVTIPYLDLSYGTDMSTRFRGRRVDFDDGYSQRGKRLNGAQQQWRLIWDRIRDNKAEELRRFFEGLQAVDLIEWTPFNQPTPLLFTADRWSSKPSGFLVSDCSIELMQEFDLA